MAVNYPALVAEIRDLRARWLRSANAYCEDPFAGTRELNETDQARERMRASRAEKKEQP